MVLLLCLFLAEPPPQSMLPPAPPQSTLAIRCQCSDDCGCNPLCYCKVKPKCAPTCTCDPQAVAVLEPRADGSTCRCQPCRCGEDCRCDGGLCGCSGCGLTNYRWSEIPGTGQHALMADGVQVGAYRHSDQKYRVYDAKANTWGAFIVPPIAPPRVAVAPTPRFRSLSLPARGFSAASC